MTTIHKALEQAPGPMTDEELAILNERGAKAWAGVNPQDLRDGSYAEPIGINGLTQAETDATMSVRGLSEPAPKRPVNCGTGHCSCIECVMKPVPSTARAIVNMDAEAQASLRHFLSAAMIFSPTWPKEPASEQQKAHGDAMHARALAAVDEWFLLHDGRAAPKLEGERTGQHINVEKSSHRLYATERERLQALAKPAQQGREVEKIINEAVKRNPQAFVFKGEKK